MKIKKYIAPTMPEVMNKIRRELGPDAVILNSREIKRGGFLGLFKKINIEVVAALDPEPIPLKSTEEIQTSSKTPLREEENNAHTAVLQEIQHLKSILGHRVFQANSSYLPEFQLAYQHLIDQEVDVQLAHDITDTVQKKYEENSKGITAQMVMFDIQSEIKNRLNGVPFPSITYEKKIIHFVGPTGVGKTTTIAKIAASAMLNDDKKVAFITTDTYRIAAIDQLKTYARILNVPMEIAYTTEDYQKALEKLAFYDVIFVDTAGRNFRDDKYIHELKDMIEFNVNTETYLVLSLTAKVQDIIAIQHQFKLLGIQKVIFTKTDETKQFGSMLNIALKHDMGIAYLTNGQDVPEDLINPTSEKISEWIVSGNEDA